MSTVYRYRVNCLTDSKYEYVWGTEEPTKCPINTAHTIDSVVTVVNEIDPNEVQVKEEHIPTGGHFQATTLKLHALANTTSSISTAWPFNITAFGVNFVTTEAHAGDIMNMSAGKDTIIGAITADVTPAADYVTQNYVAGESVVWTHPNFGDRVYTCIANTVANNVPTDTSYWCHGLAVSVSDTVIAHTAKGYYLKLNNFVNSDEVNRVITIDTNNKKVYVETNPTNSYSALSPTYVQQTVYMMKDFEMGHGWARNVGEMKIGGTHIPVDTHIMVEYTNNSPNVNVDVIGHVEYLY